MKTSISYIFVIATLMVTTGCQQQLSEAGSNNEDSLVISWPQDIGLLDPHGYGENQMFAQNLVYESLVQHDEEGDIKPHLAESWEISDDGKTYTFFLREDVQFSDGSEFNAENAKKNFDAVIEAPEDHAWLELANQINRTEVIDSFTFEITLEDTYYPLLEELALVRPFRFLGEAGFNEDQQFKEPIGTGPWVLHEYRKDEEAVFHRNDHYWGEKPEMEELVVRVIPDGDARVMAFENGEIDMIYGSGLISLDAFDHLQNNENYETGTSPPQANRVMALNSNRGVTEDHLVRQALIHAFDAHSFIEDMLYETEEHATSLFPDDAPYQPDDLDPYEYDPLKAESLLEEAGWERRDDHEIREKDGQPLQLTFVFDANDEIQTILAEYMQSELRALGVDIVLSGVDNQSYLDAQKTGDFDIIYHETWGAQYDPHAMLSSMRVPSHADYQAQRGLADKDELDEKISQVLVETDEQQREEQYDDIIRTLHDEAIYVPISSPSTTGMYHNDIEGVRYSPIPYEFSLEHIRR
ncbi:nickel ABC transporter, nickel/metallophore periplasmic binding protein [Salicibibacter cibi]|uniref:Nickel ABC transporter, nickel/metallophore periplasmic binding protein n=1 Tax=Salicibibacter cibi TaxID=2743001 RepID=A0A7T6Z8H8_9BACI|nr:nickel ABC transporter substrate-binding protein [Salicibibacter cibi]QQK78898.1 nickel ABC transporter, nickel/metallophore periplasmic binding protein [Salicibibacter cibi]